MYRDSGAEDEDEDELFAKAPLYPQGGIIIGNQQGSSEYGRRNSDNLVLKIGTVRVEKKSAQRSDERRKKRSRRGDRWNAACKGLRV